MTSRFVVLLCRIKCYLIKGLNLPSSSTSWYLLLKWLYIYCLTMFSSFSVKVTTFSILKILSLSAKIIYTNLCIYNLCYLRRRKKFKSDGYFRTGMYPLLLEEVAPTDHGIWEKQILSSFFCRICNWAALRTMYLLACQMKVTVGNSGLCCCVCTTSFEH